MDMKDFADLRGADYGKLSKGLGLEAMAIPDVHEDTATMGAMAVMQLIDRNGLDPRTIGRAASGRSRRLTVLNPRRRTSLTCSPNATLSALRRCFRT